MRWKLYAVQYLSPTALFGKHSCAAAIAEYLPDTCVSVPTTRLLYDCPRTSFFCLSSIYESRKATSRIGKWRQSGGQPVERDKWSTFVQVPCSHGVKSTRQCRMSVKCISCGVATWLLSHLPALPTQIFFFFYLGPVCISSGSTSAIKAYCAYPKLSSAQIQYPSISYKETEVPECNWVKKFGSRSGFPITL
jgi:hypothetical protein